MNELLPLLPTLVTLARTGSVSQSARVLGVPRSTVSRRLTRIEGAVGVKVAERNHKMEQFFAQQPRSISSATSGSSRGGRRARNERQNE